MARHHSTSECVWKCTAASTLQPAAQQQDLHATCNEPCNRSTTNVGRSNSQYPSTTHAESDKPTTCIIHVFKLQVVVGSRNSEATAKPAWPADWCKRATKFELNATCIVQRFVNICTACSSSKLHQLRKCPLKHHQKDVSRNNNSNSAHIFLHRCVQPTHNCTQHTALACLPLALQYSCAAATASVMC